MFFGSSSIKRAHSSEIQGNYPQKGVNVPLMMWKGDHETATSAGLSWWAATAVRTATDYIPNFILRTLMLVLRFVMVHTELAILRVAS